MTTDVDNTALAVFLFFFALVTVMGLIAARWRRPKTLAHLDEWGLGGRQVGTWITLVPSRRRFLHRIYGDRRSGSGLLGRCLWCFRIAVYDHRFPVCRRLNRATPDRPNREP